MRRHKLYILGLLLFAFLAGSCGAVSGWNRVPADDPQLGQTVPVKGDPDVSPALIIPRSWPRCAVLQNTGEPAAPAFRNIKGEVYVYRETVPTGGNYGMRRGHDGFDAAMYAAGHPAPVIVNPDILCDDANNEGTPVY